jgi:hypothetical protein
LRDLLAEVDSGQNGGARLGLRLNAPDEETFAAVLQLRSSADPSLVVDAADLWSAPATVLARLGDQAETDLLLAVRRWRCGLATPLEAVTEPVPHQPVDLSMYRMFDPPGAE